MFHLGGAIEDTPEDASGYSHRDAQEVGVDADRLAQAFGRDTLQRLSTVKDRYDPDHVFGEFPMSWE